MGPKGIKGEVRESFFWILLGGIAWSIVAPKVYWRSLDIAGGIGSRFRPLVPASDDYDEVVILSSQIPYSCVHKLNIRLLVPFR